MVDNKPLPVGLKLFDALQSVNVSARYGMRSEVRGRDTQQSVRPPWAIWRWSCSWSAEREVTVWFGGQTVWRGLVSSTCAGVLVDQGAAAVRRVSMSDICRYLLRWRATAFCRSSWREVQARPRHGCLSFCVWLLEICEVATWCLERWCSLVL